jgi:hypothetical protein
MTLQPQGVSRSVSGRDQVLADLISPPSGAPRMLAGPKFLEAEILQEFSARFLSPDAEVMHKFKC